MPDNEKITMWNGGDTNKSKEQVIREWNRMIRNSEDYLDRVDVETNGEFNPRDNINKNMDKPAEISGGEPRNRYRRPEGDLVSDNNE